MYFYNSAVEIWAPINTVAALLTTFEFVITLITAYCTRSLFHAISLYRLYSRGSLSIGPRNIASRRRLSDWTVLFLGFGLMNATALVEKDLEPSFRVSDTRVSPSQCVRMDDYFPRNISLNTVPDRSVRFERWPFRMATLMRCGNTGLSTIHAGGTYDEQGRITNLSAPICAEPSSDDNVLAQSTSPKLVATMGQLRVSRVSGVLQQTHAAINLKTDFFEALPYSFKAYRTEANSPWLFNSSSGGEVEPSQISNTTTCFSRQISLTSLCGGRWWNTEYVESAAVCRFMQGSLCALHGDRKVETLPSGSSSGCYRSSKKRLNVPCVAKKAKTLGVPTYSSDVENITALFVKHPSEEAYACVEAKVRYHYLFMNGTDLDFKRFQFGVLIPVKVELLSGDCERTIFGLGRVALASTVDAEWSNTAFREADRRSRFNALTLLLALPVLSTQAMKLGNVRTDRQKPCELRAIHEITLINRDWKYWLLVFMITVDGIALVAGLCARLFFQFKHRPWNVASPSWTTDLLIHERSDLSPQSVEVRTEARTFGTGKVGLSEHTTRSYRVISVRPKQQDHSNQSESRTKQQYDSSHSESEGVGDVSGKD